MTEKQINESLAAIMLKVIACDIQIDCIKSVLTAQQKKDFNKALQNATIPSSVAVALHPRLTQALEKALI